MDDNEVFVPTEESIKDIVRNEVLQAMATTKPPEGNPKVSFVDKKPSSKRSGKQRQSQQSQRSRLKSATHRPKNMARRQKRSEEKVPAT